MVPTGKEIWRIYKTFAWNSLSALRFFLISSFKLEIQLSQDWKVSLSVGSEEQYCIPLHLFYFDSYILGKLYVNGPTVTCRYNPVGKQIHQSFTVHYKFWLHLKQVHAGGTGCMRKANRNWPCMERLCGGMGVYVNHSYSKWQITFCHLSSAEFSFCL